MLCKCKSCGWLGSIAKATLAGARLKSRPCPECKHKALTRVGNSHGDTRAQVAALVNDAAATGKLAGEPLRERTLLEQVAGLDAGESFPAPPALAAAERGGLADFAARKRAAQTAMQDVRDTAVQSLALQQRQTRAAVISAKATKRELRRIASAAGALVELGRALVQTLDTRLGQMYAATECAVGLLVEIRNHSRQVERQLPRLLALGAEIQRADRAKAGAADVGPLPPVEDGPADFCGTAGGVALGPVADLSPFFDTIEAHPEPGDILTLDGGDTWTVSGTASAAVTVICEYQDSAAPREIALTLPEWRAAVRRARKASRPGAFEIERTSPTHAERRAGGAA